MRSGGRSARCPKGRGETLHSLRHHDRQPEPEPEPDSDSVRDGEHGRRQSAALAQTRAALSQKLFCFAAAC
eukprot:755387-Rhodomonas_salina.1